MQDVVQMCAPPFLLVLALTTTLTTPVSGAKNAPVYEAQDAGMALKDAQGLQCLTYERIGKGHYGLVESCAKGAGELAQRVIDVVTGGSGAGGRLARETKDRERERGLPMRKKAAKIKRAANGVLRWCMWGVRG